MIGYRMIGHRMIRVQVNKDTDYDRIIAMIKL